MRRNVIIIVVISIILISIALILYLGGYSSTSNILKWHINTHCSFYEENKYFDHNDSAYNTGFIDFIDLKKALNVDYDTLHLISVGFETDISDIIGFKYHGFMD